MDIFDRLLQDFEQASTWQELAVLSDLPGPGLVAHAQLLTATATMASLHLVWQDGLGRGAVFR
ncbi:hypothetical protein [Comamonas sp. JC664]|uniref:hypothetical protein n=1 Tax=Comamonas sp. JC664 TaxID=2801917 RepID=UPI003620F4A3